MADYHCPKCAARCRTVESLGIHTKRCRALSVDEIADFIDDVPAGRNTARQAAIDLHKAMVDRLRGRKGA